MKKFLLSFACLPSLALAENYICSYPGYLSGEPVIIQIAVEGDVARVGRHELEYRVLENNETGLVLVHSFSYQSERPSDKNDIGLYGLVIDKSKMTMIRGNIIYPDTRNSLKTGACIK
jgi:hypothetical protein